MLACKESLEAFISEVFSLTFSFLAFRKLILLAGTIKFLLKAASYQLGFLMEPRSRHWQDFPGIVNMSTVLIDSSDYLLFHT